MNSEEKYKIQINVENIKNNKNNIYYRIVS